MSTKEKAKEVLSKLKEESEDTFNRVLEEIAEDHKPRVARTRLFLYGLGTGILLSVLVVLIF